MEDQPAVSYTLGIDLGANSLGWAALRVDGGEPTAILDVGVRVFPAGMTGLESGKDESNAANRRLARLQRRQTDRRRRRLHKIYRMLASYGLLPGAATVEDRIHAVDTLDRTLAEKHHAHENLPYVLRAKALDGKLEPFELGRALFHLAQRRGFLSNRKVAKDSDEERGKVKDGITSLAASIAASGSRTLGEHLCRLNSHEARIRGRYTSRSMYLDEFERVWSAQAEHHRELTAGRKAQLFHAMFHQRPLRDQSHLIGDCELETGEKRAPLWHPLSQRFRLLQEVNNLRLENAARGARPLSPEERQNVIARLEQGDLPVGELKKMLSLNRSVTVNLDSGGKKALTGDRTEHKMRQAFLHLWDEIPAAGKLEAISDLAGDMDADELTRKAERRWGLNGIQAKLYAAETSLETGKYLSYSLKAIAKLLPDLERGCDVTSARIAQYPDTFRTEVRDVLPPVLSRLKEIRNPAVVRALTELRKVVNALILRHGKPAEIHIELARDLKAPKAEREEKWKRMRRNESDRNSAADAILREVGTPNPSRADKEKWLLAQECNWRCPYTQRGFGKTQLFHTGEIQVEHIIPFSRSLDDSFANKTLAYSSINATKGNRSPLEAFAANPQDWEEIRNEVGAFKGPYRKHKLERFQWTTERIAENLGDFTSRQLNDTRYASRLAARYLACLYGGLNVEGEKQRIFVSPGQVTAFLRRLWAIEGLLSGGQGKTRDDHRQHAVDAAVVALTGPKWVKALSDAACRAWEQGRRRFASMEAPWQGFADEVRRKLDGIVVSHRADHRVGAAMHEDTFYGLVELAGAGPKTVRRKFVHLLSAGELEQIVDQRVRERVALQLGIHQGKFEELEKDPPTLPTRDGREIKIGKVRIQVAKDPRRIGGGLRARNVVGDNYHHFEILRRKDTQSGAGKRARGMQWDFVAVSGQTAMERVRDKQPVVSRDHGPDAEFVCSIAKGDTLEIERDGQKMRILVCALAASNKRISFQALTDARPSRQENQQRAAINVLMGKLKCRKVCVTPLGEVRYDND